ncbi:MAG: hypothetical protein KDD82_16700, partial [Planctomycetes bacterium]|nr:hypothetical protein [Planctomycetota bacterium]
APATPATPATPVEPATPATPDAPGTPAADRGWTRLGTRNVGFGVDRDAITVTAAEGRFTRLRFHVGGNALIVDWIKVTFGNGETWEHNPQAPVRIAQGATSAAIDLPGGARVIKRIEFKYRTPVKKALRGKANVTAFGFRAGVDPTPNNGR